MDQQEKIMMAPAQSLKTGDLFLKEGLVSSEDIESALSIQQKRKEAPVPQMKRLLGIILCDLNLITPIDNYYVLHKYDKLITIESALVSEDILSENEVSRISSMAKQDDVPFISCLFKDSFISSRQMQRFLFSLFYIPFRSITDFTFNKEDRETLVNIIDRQRAEEHRVVPLVAKDNTIMFGITEPDNLLLIRQLNEQFPQYRFKALFVPYSGYVWFSKVVYSQAKEKNKIEPKPSDVSTLLDFKAAVKDPKADKKEIWILYERYELMRQLMGNSRRDNYLDEFNQFIQNNHNKIRKEYKCSTIEYSLKKNGDNISIAATPKR